MTTTLLVLLQMYNFFKNKNEHNFQITAYSDKKISQIGWSPKLTVCYIENLQYVSADIPRSLLLRIIIRQNDTMLSLTSLHDNVAGRRKDSRIRYMIKKIKTLLVYYGSPSQ